MCLIIKENRFFVMTTIIMVSFYLGNAQTVVNSLSELRVAVQSSNQEIVMQSGSYNLEDLSSSSRNITCSGSNNTIDLTNVYINVPVGSVKTSYFVISGDDNTVIGGEIEDVYRSGITEITDFSAYNQDRDNFAYGLNGAAVMTVSGDDNLVDGTKLTVRGSFPYGYGSMYGIGSGNTFGLDKRCGILITGVRNTLNNVELQHRAFGHGIYMQSGADETVIKNTLVEGRVRESAELYNETNSYDLPFRANYLMPHWDYDPIPTDEFHSLCEDGFRMYGSTGSITLENCTAKKMRGGIRLYLGGSAKVINSTSIDCGETSWNMPSGGEIINSFGNFAYSTMSDFRLSKNNMNIEWTIIPSPHATGPHNLADVLGNNHNIIFHRTPGPIDTDLRPIVISGNNSTIVNETEYPVILESSTSGNTIITCSSVTDNGLNNNVFDCNEENICENILAGHNGFNNSIFESVFDCNEDYICGNIIAENQVNAENFCDSQGVDIKTASEGGSYIGDIQSGDYLSYGAFNFDENTVNAVEVAIGKSSTKDTFVEVRLDSPTGTLIGTVDASETTGGSQNWVTKRSTLNDISGEHDIFFVFTGQPSVTLVNFNWFSFFFDSSLSINENKHFYTNLYPNPVTDKLFINDNEDLDFEIYNSLGQLKYKNHLKSNQYVIDMSRFSSGIYFIKVISTKGVAIKKIIRE